GTSSTLSRRLWSTPGATSDEGSAATSRPRPTPPPPPRPTPPPPPTPRASGPREASGQRWTSPTPPRHASPGLVPAPQRQLPTAAAASAADGRRPEQRLDVAEELRRGRHPQRRVEPEQDLAAGLGELHVHLGRPRVVGQDVAQLVRQAVGCPGQRHRQQHRPSRTLLDLRERQLLGQELGAVLAPLEPAPDDPDGVRRQHRGDGHVGPRGEYAL